MLRTFNIKVKFGRFSFHHTHCMYNIFTGGTDICGCFAAQNWTVPVTKGEIQSSILGCAVQCFNEEGERGPTIVLQTTNLSLHLIMSRVPDRSCSMVSFHFICYET